MLKLSRTSLTAVFSIGSVGNISVLIKCWAIFFVLISFIGDLFLQCVQEDVRISYFELFIVIIIREREREREHVASCIQAGRGDTCCWLV